MSYDCIEKHSSAVEPSYTVATSVGSAKEIPFGSMSTGLAFVPTGSSIATLTFYAAEKPGGTYLPIYTYDGDAAVIATITAARAYEFPPGVYGAKVLKIVGDAAGTIYLTLKS